MNYPDEMVNDGPLWLHFLADDYSGRLEREPHQPRSIVSRDFVTGACDSPAQVESCAA